MKPEIVTYSGRVFDLADPKPEMVSIIDIAYALSNICRYAGHTKYFYSVAEHSVRMAVCKEFGGAAMDRLLHDAAEAYIGDVTSPMKKLIPEFKEIERRIMDAIIAALDWQPRPSQVPVKEADNIMLATEVRDLMQGAAKEWDCCRAYKPLAGKIIPWSRHRARWTFIAAYDSLRSIST